MILRMNKADLNVDKKSYFAASVIPEIDKSISNIIKILTEKLPCILLNTISKSLKKNLPLPEGRKRYFSYLFQTKGQIILYILS